MIYASSKDAIKKKLTGTACAAGGRLAGVCPPPAAPPPASCSRPPLFPAGIKHELQANCYEEVKDRCTLAEKLGGSAVISLEGKPL